ncbi:CvpA family protein [Bathymodiolus septemdierum thioautotrophic gill symbiont]|uniref:Uncharacterized protein n=1 Tax=endosymbiont of Bathymodiolus septemdierum str. Myojin knoll TaxID=1303921 RepID=A0A0N7KB67_9GAMM|nr:CvpA family protein [Bathymodiolus septemdierum thioautotrophic gill symbiont]BAS67167.1 conserved hypothetical protein [endosymbiont of Bathymodiolus septemdierum str. Myojin knoll]
MNLTTMTEFITNIGNYHWSVWVSLIIFIGFGVRGYERGMARELIGLGFLVLSFTVAWLFYIDLSGHPIITWMSLSLQSNMAIAFGVIFVLVEAAKMVLYKVIAMASKISEPCTLNKSFLVGFLLIATAVFNYYIDVIFDFNFIEIMATSNFFHSMTSFAIMFFAFIGFFVTLSKLFKRPISTSYPCFLSAFIQGILNTLSALDDKLNATNISGGDNYIFGAIIGLIKGFAFIILMILILQSIDTISQGYFWAESQSSLGVFQDVVTSIKLELSQHLLFIKND